MVVALSLLVVIVDGGGGVVVVVAVSLTLLVMVAVDDTGGGVVVVSTEVVGWLRHCHGRGRHMVVVVVVNNVDILWFNVLI